MAGGSSRSSRNSVEIFSLDTETWRIGIIPGPDEFFTGNSRNVLFLRCDIFKHNLKDSIAGVKSCWTIELEEFMTSKQESHFA